MNVADQPRNLPLEWIPASEALEHLYRHHGGWLGTKFLLAELLKDGKLRARAARIWSSDASSITAAWKTRADAEAEENVEVDASVWRSSRYWLEDVINWRWPDNRFLLTRTKRPAERTFVEGVEFQRAQVVELLPQMSRKNIGGRNIRATDWEKIGVALIAMAHHGAFGTTTPGNERTRTFKNKAEFVDKILAATGDVYSRSHAFALLGPIYAHFHPQTASSSLQTAEADSF